MQLSTVKISNILSFPYVENLTTIEWIKFRNHKNGLTNIIIGPNGSGKSNLMNIISSLWKHAITIPYELDLIHKKIIQKAPHWHHLNKFRGQENLSSHIYMSIYLSSDDIANIFFVIQKREIFNNIISSHSDKKITIPHFESKKIAMIHKIPFYCTLWADNILILEDNTNDKVIKFIQLYFQNFELLQHCIEIYNITQKEKRKRLNNTFSFITHEYNYLPTPNTKPLRLFLKKYETLSSDNKQEQKSLQHLFITSVNRLLVKYIQLTVTINQTDISFITKDNKSYTYHELSSGEQSFIRLILLISSHDLHNGLLMIDEPETHLHPQAQKEFLKLIQEIRDQQKVQVIISTHSPSLINEENIHNVFRCSKDKGATKIYSTPHYNKQSDKNLLQLLKFDAIAKVFFVDKIILVEGDTDFYFFSFYLEYLAQDSQRSSRIKNYEVLAINGKWGVSKRKKFLKKFNNNVSYIGDRDNITEFGIISYEEIRSFQQQAGRALRENKYSSVVTFLNKKKPNIALHIKKGINNLYKNKTFILQQGDLESYLWIKEKGLESTISFCRENFQERLQNTEFQNKREELLSIVWSIF